MSGVQMHYLVTGGAGFIGSHLTEFLLFKGDRVTILDNLSTGRFDNLAAVKDHPNLKIIIGSVLEKELTEDLIRNVDAVFHLASAVGVQLILNQPVETIESIFHGTDIVFRYAARYRRKVLLTSSSEVYGKSTDVPFLEDGDRLEGPTTLHRWAYACAKALDEFLALSHHKATGLPVIIVRLFNTVGPRQSSRYGMVLPRFVEAALLGNSLTVYGDGQQKRCFCHVSDVVPALYNIMTTKACEGKVINVGSDEEISILDLAKTVIEITKSKSEIQLIPYEQAFPDGGFEDMYRRVPSLKRIRQLTGFTVKKSLNDIIFDVVDERRQYLGLEKI